MGSRRDYTEAFLSTTSDVSPLRQWPSPHMSSWNRFSTWTSSCFYTLKVSIWACLLWVIKQLHLNASFTEWFKVHSLCLNIFLEEIAFSLCSLKASGKLMVEKEIGYKTVRYSMPILFHSLLLDVCDFPPHKRWFTSPHDMWLEFEQVPHQCVHGYRGATLFLLDQLDGSGVMISFFLTMLFATPQQLVSSTQQADTLTCLHLSFSWPHLQMDASLKWSSCLVSVSFCTKEKGRTGICIYLNSISYLNT